MPHPTPTEIAAAIIESFKRLPGRLGPGKGDRVWTTQLKDDMGTLGEKYDWTVCAGGFKERFEGGWLYDLVWYKEANGHLSEVYLVLESEWGKHRTQIKYDFEKLVLAKSTLKVMVFQTNNREIENLFKFLEDGIRQHPEVSSRSPPAPVALSRCHPAVGRQKNSSASQTRFTHESQKVLVRRHQLLSQTCRAYGEWDRKT